MSRFIMGCYLSCKRSYESPHSSPSFIYGSLMSCRSYPRRLGDEEFYNDFISYLNGVSPEETKQQEEIEPLSVQETVRSRAVASSDTASTSHSHLNEYEVFLSFRGEDIRRSFTGHLYSALKNRGICTFIDDKLRQGEELAPALVQAIAGSRMAIVIFSEKYANSSWCLDELVRILECKEWMGQIVMPVFYKVDPSQVRKQSGTFAEAFSTHEKNYNQNLVRISKWKQALSKVANLKGWHLTDHDCESNIIQEIVKEVVSRVDSKELHLSDNLVGMDSHLKDMSSLLDARVDDVRMIGIWGMGGIGKTTIAKTIYNQIRRGFEFSKFLANVRESCEKHSQIGLLHLQETLLAELLWDGELKHGNIDEGIGVIKRRMCSKKVLIVLDDVDHLEQLEALAGACDWFGSGSRIIITTRNKHLLVAHRVKQLYNAKPLNDFDALCLFSSVAFQNILIPEQNYFKLSREFIEYAQGLPLAVKVLGSFLCGRSLSEWTSTLKKLKTVANREIFKVLKISFDSLDDFEKTIFLDIACFFKGQSVDYVKKVLESCGLFAEIGMRVLVDKSLITTKSGVVEMHDVIQEMGKEIVRQESSEELGKRTRLWFHEHVLDVLTGNTGTSKIQGIKLDLGAQEDVCFSDDAFTKMKRLRILIAHKAVPSGGASLCFPNGLRWLEWPEYSLPSLPFGSGQKKLVGLCMSKSSIKTLGDELKLFRNLKFVDFSHSTSLSKLPDLSSLRNLESLNVSHCKSLTEVHDSLGILKKLIHLNFLNCCNLSSFPSSLRSRPLQSLILKGCSNISIFPEILVEVKDMTELYLDETGIEELPHSIGNFVGLKAFYLKDCKKLKSLPGSIYKMGRLEYLDLSGCSQFEKFPNFGEGTNAIIPLYAFPNLIFFDFRGCNLSEVNFLDDLHCVSTLTLLNLSENKFLRLPKGINRFTKLQQLNLTNCRQLQAIPELPPNISHLFAEGCESLKSYASLSNMLQAPPSQSSLLKRIELHGCDKLNQWSDKNIGKMLSIEELLGNARVDIFHPGSEVPTWFLYRSTKECPRNHSAEGPKSQVPKWFYLHSTERLVRFEVPSNLYPMVTGLAFCGVATSGKATKISFEIQLFVNKERTYAFVEHFPLLKLDHFWLSYIPRKLMWGLDTKLTHECSRFAVLFKVSGAVLGSCGVHLVQAPHLYEESEHDSPNLKKKRRHLTDQQKNFHSVCLDFVKTNQMVLVIKESGLSMGSFLSCICSPKAKSDEDVLFTKEYLELNRLRRLHDEKFSQEEGTSHATTGTIERPTTSVFSDTAQTYRQNMYDVFLSFRGEDTRYSFTSHLYMALWNRGINPFISDKLRQGEELAPALVRAIESSRIAILTFSENYANSSWFLVELLKF